MEVKLYNKVADVRNICEQIYKDCCVYDDTDYTVFFDDDEDYMSEHVRVLLAYIDGIPAGFISVFPDDEEQVEVCLFVKPEYRNRKVATILLDKAKENIEIINIIMPVAEEQSVDFCNKMEMELQYDELIMELRDTSLSQIMPDKSINTDELKISFEETDREFTMDYLGRIIARTNITEDNNRVWFYNVVTESEYRNKGIAAFMMKSLMSYYPTDTVFLVQVNSNNIAGMRLYKKLGFKEIDKVSYFAVR